MIYMIGASVSLHSAGMQNRTMKSQIIGKYRHQFGLKGLENFIDYTFCLNTFLKIQLPYQLKQFKTILENSTKIFKRGSQICYPALRRNIKRTPYTHIDLSIFHALFQLLLLLQQSNTYFGKFYFLSLFWNDMKPWQFGNYFKRERSYLLSIVEIFLISYYSILGLILLTDVPLPVFCVPRGCQPSCLVLICV